MLRAWPFFPGMCAGHGLGHWSWRASPISKCRGMRLGAFPRLCPWDSAQPRSGGAAFRSPPLNAAIDEDTVALLVGATIEDESAPDKCRRVLLRGKAAPDLSTNPLAIGKTPPAERTGMVVGGAAAKELCGHGLPLPLVRATPTSPPPCSIAGPLRVGEFSGAGVRVGDRLRLAGLEPGLLGLPSSGTVGDVVTKRGMSKPSRPE